MYELWLLPLTITTSTISGITGFGGGTILITVMSEFLAPKILIPVHGFVQFSSNASRVYLSRQNLRYDLILRYGLGALAGALLGVTFVLQISGNFLWLLVGGFLLITTWAPKLKFRITIPLKYEIVGLVSTFMSMFVGVTGPLLHPIMLREKLEKDEFIGSEAACCCITHALKVFSYAAISIKFLKLWPLMLGLAICATIGSYIGKNILNRLSLDQFYILIKVVVTLMAFRMIWKGTFGA